MSAPLIDDELLALMRGPVSIIAAGRDADNRPQLMRAIGCRISADRSRVTLLMARATSAALLASLQANGAIAAVFTRPSTNRSVQLKGNDARVEAIEPGDLAELAAYAQRFADELVSIGFSDALVRTLMDPCGEVVGVGFTPAQAFDQTPGPRAGRSLNEAKAPAR